MLLCTQRVTVYYMRIPFVIVFQCFCSARIDGLVKREESHEEMTESFVSRDDYMYHRQVTFGKRIKKFGPQDANARPILVRRVLKKVLLSI